MKVILKIDTTNLKQFYTDQNMIKNHIWITAKGVRVPVKQMNTSHIRGCINCFKGRGKVIIPDRYLGGKEKWLKIFNQELLNRQ